MPLAKRPYVASADQVRITRQGEYAFIEYADEAVASTQLKVGADELASMTDEQLLDYWNELVQNNDDFRARVKYVAEEIPLGKPQVEYFELGDQWTPRGHVLRCQILSDAAIPPKLTEPFVSIDGRDFTLAEFMRMVGTFGGWGIGSSSSLPMRCIFVPS